MAEPVNETLDAAVEAVNVANVKTIAEAGAFFMAQAMGNHVSHGKRLDILAENALAKAVEGIQTLDAAESTAIQKLLSGNDLAQTMSSLGTAIAQLQQLMKGAQSTPPETAKPA